jgi:predicted nicotinamide N-methyase
MSDSDSDVEEVEYEPEEFTFFDHKITVTTIAYMPLTVLMNNRSKEVEISGQKLWCGSLVVLSYMLQHPEIVSGKSVIELGAGTGVLSMLAKKVGAIAAVATDHDIRSINHMIEDCQRNAVDVKVVTMDWFRPELSAVGESIHPEEPVVLLAGDVLYKAILLDPFFDTVVAIFDRYQAHPVTLYLCHVPRAGITHDMVVEKAISSGFQVHVYEQAEWLENVPFVSEYSPEEDIVKARLYRISKVV